MDNPQGPSNFTGMATQPTDNLEQPLLQL